MSVDPNIERAGAIARIKELETEESMQPTKDSLIMWWEHSDDGIELCELRQQLFGDPFERIDYLDYYPDIRKDK